MKHRHCWHEESRRRGRLGGMPWSWLEVCCHCEEERRTVAVEITRPGHGPYMPKHEAVVDVAYGPADMMEPEEASSRAYIPLGGGSFFAPQFHDRKNNPMPAAEVVRRLMEFTEAVRRYRAGEDGNALYWEWREKHEAEAPTDG